MGKDASGVVSFCCSGGRFAKVGAWHEGRFPVDLRAVPGGTMRLFQAIFTAALLASPLACRVESGAEKYTADELEEFRNKHQDDAEALRKRLEEAQAQRSDNAHRTLDRLEEDLERRRAEPSDTLTRKLEDMNE